MVKDSFINSELWSFALFAGWSEIWSCPANWDSNRVLGAWEQIFKEQFIAERGKDYRTDTVVEVAPLCNMFWCKYFTGPLYVRYITFIIKWPWLQSCLSCTYNVIECSLWECRADIILETSFIYERHSLWELKSIPLIVTWAKENSPLR